MFLSLSKSIGLKMIKTLIPIGFLFSLMLFYVKISASPVSEPSYNAIDGGKHTLSWFNPECSIDVVIEEAKSPAGLGFAASDATKTTWETETARIDPQLIEEFRDTKGPTTFASTSEMPVSTDGGFSPGNQMDPEQLQDLDNDNQRYLDEDEDVANMSYNEIDDRPEIVIDPWMSFKCCLTTFSV